MTVPLKLNETKNCNLLKLLNTLIYEPICLFQYNQYKSASMYDPPKICSKTNLCWAHLTICNLIW